MNIKYQTNALMFILLIATHVCAENAIRIKKWGLQHTQAHLAAEVTTHTQTVRVAIIDTGVDTNNPELKKYLWQNPNEKLNGIDDDKNGFIDDIHGWNFSHNSNVLTDTHGHGTHIAGIINDITPQAKLMILKYYDAKATPLENMKNSVKAIEYATQMKAQVINFSAGGLDKNQDEKLAIQKANENGILYVAAAGNEHSNADFKGFYPANYDISNIISVTAIDQDNAILSSSNYGTRTVHIAAPGKDILSTLPGSRNGIMTGTSQATAFVSGAAALLISQQNGVYSLSALKNSLLKTGFRNMALINKTMTGSSLNIYRAATMKDFNKSAFGLEISNASPLYRSIYSSTFMGPQSFNGNTP